MERDLVKLLPKDQIERVLNQEMCDIDLEFLGFTDIYYHLSQIIPKHFTVVDLGCAYNAQCFYFTDHKKYIAVDVTMNEVFKSDNCILVNRSIQAFIKFNNGRLNLDETFAICSYVPPWYNDNTKLVRETFKNCFVYYPCGGDDVKITLSNNSI